MFFGKRRCKIDTPIKVVAVERDSICAADDCNAPNGKTLQYEEGQTIADFMNVIESYLPTYPCLKWQLLCNDKTIATISYDEGSNCHMKLLIENIKVSELEENFIKCKLERL